jgi:heme/copper-type cytochrome/quinol oxidase subunit 2
MNKYVIIAIVLVGIIGAGVIFSAKTDKDNCSEGMGTSRDVTVISKKLEWRFDPEVINVEKCDKVHIKVINEDNFDHGFAIDALGISQRLPANGEIDVNFVASKAGEFPFYCSVSCSDSQSTGNLPDGKVQAGPYAGTVRGHFDQLGKFIVAEIKGFIK